MIFTRSGAGRIATAAFGSTLLLAGLASPAYAFGGDGSTKVGPVGATLDMANSPHINTCQVQVDLYGFTVNSGGEQVQARFFHQGGQQNGDPVDGVTGGPILAMPTEGPAGGTQLNGSGVYTFPATNGDLHVKMELFVEDQQMDSAKSKVFWLTCVPGPEPSQTPTTTTSPTTSTNPTTTTSPTPSVEPSVWPTASVEPTHPVKPPKKVNSGGTTDGSGLIFLGVAGAGLAAAAGFGLTRKRKS